MSNNLVDPSSKTKTKRVSRIDKFKITLILLVLLYIGVSIPLIIKFWDEIFYAITHKEDIEWLQNIRNNTWEEKKTQMLEEKRQEESKEVGMSAKKKELPANLKEVIKDTPMAEMEQAMLNNKYGVSPYLIVGIAKAESTYGTNFYHWKDYRNYNFWGIKPNSNIREDGSYLKWYSSPDEAVNDFARILRENYIDQGLNTVDKIVVRYVGRDSESWKATVNSVLALSESQELLAMK